MSQYRTALLPLLLAVFVSFPAMARADTVYDISGSITSVGNAGSNVTVDYSYVMDVGSGLYGPTFVTSNQSASGNGSLGAVFTLGSYTYGGTPGSYVPIADAEGDEIDLVSTVEDSVTPSFATWYKCQLACIPDFMPPGSSNSVYYNAGAYYGAAPFTMTQTVAVITPEASTGLMLLAGIMLLPFLRRRSSLRPQPSR